MNIFIIGVVVVVIVVAGYLGLHLEELLCTTCRPRARAELLGDWGLGMSSSRVASGANDLFLAVMVCGTPR